MATIDKDELKEKTDRMTKAMTSEAYLKQIEKVREAGDDEKMVAASKYLTPEALRRAGVDLPADSRMSSRFFESRDTVVELGDTGHGPNVVNVLNERHPGLLDKLKNENPDVFKEIITPSEIEAPPLGDPGTMAICYCYGSKDGGCHGGGL